MTIIPGGVTAPQGFTAAGIHAGIKAGSSPDKNDLCLIVSEKECAAAATYTLNRVKAAPLYVTMGQLEDGTCRAIVANSGNANACCPYSHEYAERTCAAAAKALGLNKTDLAVASTGVIGVTLNVEAIEAALPALVQKLSASGSHDAATAIMTTDTRSKEVAVQVEIGGKMVTIGAVAKGSGMIHPNMGTMLAFITTDCAITHEMLDRAIRSVVKRTFNRVTVDGDTSTNDMCLIMANSMADNPLIEWKDANYAAFLHALTEVCTHLARAIAADGEGASKLITCDVSGARNEDVAERLAKQVVGSALVKAAMFGADANWGRVICAMGYSKAPFRPEHVNISFRSSAGEVAVCRQGEALPFDEDLAKQVLTQDAVDIVVTLTEGDGCAKCWGCDLTYEYVRINGDYRT